MYKKLQTQFFIRNLMNTDLSPSITRKKKLGGKGRQEMNILTCIIAYKESFFSYLLKYKTEYSFLGLGLYTNFYSEIATRIHIQNEFMQHGKGIMHCAKSLWSKYSLSSQTILIWKNTEKAQEYQIITKGHHHSRLKLPKK
jgi:hypothetical protein